MSTSVVNENDFVWDTFTSFPGSSREFQGQDIDWPVFELDGLDEESIENATTFSPASDRQSSRRVSDSRDIPSQVKDNVERSPKKVQKGRQHGDLEFEQGNQSAKDRRRSQVRRAQQAYRDRERATIASLRRDVDDLKTRLIGMDTVSSELFDIIASLEKLPSKTKWAIESLHLKEEQYRLPKEMRTAVMATPRKTKFSNKDENRAIFTNSSNDMSDNPEILRPLGGANLEDPQSVTRLAQSKLPKDQQLPVIDIYQNSGILQPNLGPPIGNLSDIHESPIAFSAQLRHEALREAYGLIMQPETPYRLLCKKFRHCIFSCTRDEILRNLTFLIHDSARMAYRADSTSMITGIDTSSETDETYVHIEELGDYFTKVGLAIKPGSSFAELPMTSENLAIPTNTVFDEIRQRERIRISIRKLFHELLARMVCLGVGPGILASKIDEAIRSTIIAS